MLGRFATALILIDFFLLSNESAHPQGVVIVEDETLVVWVDTPIVFEHV